MPAREGGLSGPEYVLKLLQGCSCTAGPQCHGPKSIGTVAWPSTTGYNKSGAHDLSMS